LLPPAKRQRQQEREGKKVRKGEKRSAFPIGVDLTGILGGTHGGT